MANIKSALKAIRKTSTNYQRNLVQKRNFREARKAVLSAIAAKDKKTAESLMPAAQKALDKAAKNNVIHKKTSDRYKSRLVEKIKAIG